MFAAKPYTYQLFKGDNKIGITLMAPETGCVRASVGKNEVFSSKNPVSVVGCVSPVKLNYT